MVLDDLFPTRPRHYDRPIYVVLYVWVVGGNVFWKEVSMNHLDLFSGIGGFAYAVDQVWPGSTHTFCDNNLFCQKVLAKHWPESKIYGDIRTITNTEYQRPVSPEHKERTRCKEGVFEGHKLSDAKTDLLTGGFPCQPFSQAGKRRGTSDERYLWPEMLRVIQLTKPTWVIAENVRGLTTWSEGLVLEQVCADLEAEGYQVQPFIVPACAVNAPHRRDRVWIVANRKRRKSGQQTEWKGREDISRGSEESIDDANSASERLEGNNGIQGERCAETGWEQNWLEVATRLCRMDDGLPNRVDRLKALGNAIVPQVAIQIMKAIKTTYV